MMYKFSSFDEKTFYKAIEEKDYSRLKTCIISSIRNNPGFKKAKGEKCSEAGLAMNILKEKVPEILEHYVVQETEQVYNVDASDTWDKEYFIRQTFLLGENFCMERYNHLVKIGEKIMNGTAPNFQEPQEKDQAETKNKLIQEKAYAAPRKFIPLLVLGVVILTLIILVVIDAVIK